VRRKGILVAAAVVLVVVAVPALADDLGTVGGVHYQSSSIALDADSGVLSTQLCGQGEKATGAGFGTVTSSLQPSEVAPFDGDDGDEKPDDMIAVRLLAQADDTATFFAICADVHVKYVEKAKESASSEVDSVKAKCPSGRHLVGGGGNAGNKFLGSSFPYDSKDDGNKPDDGWKATAYGVPATTIEAIAVCSEEMPDYDKVSISLGPSAGNTIGPECDGNSHISALGAQMTGPQEFAELRSLSIQDNNDGNSVPDDDALVYMVNSPSASDEQTFTGWAVCIG